MSKVRHKLKRDGWQEIFTTRWISLFVIRYARWGHVPQTGGGCILYLGHFMLIKEP